MLFEPSKHSASVVLERRELTGRLQLAPHLGLRLEAPGYISRYEHNKPASLSPVKLHWGRCRSQVFTRRRNARNTKVNISCFAALILIFYLCPSWVWQRYWSAMWNRLSTLSVLTLLVVMHELWGCYVQLCFPHLHFPPACFPATVIVYPRPVPHSLPSPSLFSVGAPFPPVQVHLCSLQQTFQPFCLCYYSVRL